MPTLALKPYTSCCPCFFSSSSSPSSAFFFFLFSFLLSASLFFYFPLLSLLSFSSISLVFSFSSHVFLFSHLLSSLYSLLSPLSSLLPPLFLALPGVIDLRLICAINPRTDTGLRVVVDYQNKDGVANSYGHDKLLVVLGRSILGRFHATCNFSSCGCRVCLNMFVDV